VLRLATLKLMGFAIPRSAFSMRRNIFFSAFVKRVTDTAHSVGRGSDVRDPSGRVRAVVAAHETARGLRGGRY